METEFYRSCYKTPTFQISWCHVTGNVIAIVRVGALGTHRWVRISFYCNCILYRFCRRCPTGWITTITYLITDKKWQAILISHFIRRLILRERKETCDVTVILYQIKRKIVVGKTAGSLRYFTYFRPGPLSSRCFMTVIVSVNIELVNKGRCA